MLIRSQGSLLLAALTICCLVALSSGEPNRKSDRKGKFFSVFQVIRFNNDACDGGDRNGTCYTEQECSARGGENSGSCADGYGVCCTFVLNCGESSSENCTHFESEAPAAGTCKTEICPCNDSICQLRLDFLAFQITGPSTNPAVTAKILNGVIVKSSGVPVSVSSRCLVDSFSVVNTGSGMASDVICGVNTGQHLYVETDNGCTDLAFQFGQTGAGARNWNIKVTQYGCESPVRAPQGCDQFFFGANTGTVESFNYNAGNGQQLASQDQSICVRRERGTCRICWLMGANDRFDISGKSNVKAVTKDTVCGGYGSKGKDVNSGYDFVHFPGARNTALTANLASNRCGRQFTKTTGLGAMIKAVCSTQTPFSIRFRSDSFENTADLMSESSVLNDGFRLTYILDNNC